MKLKLYAVDFVKNTVTFSVPPEIMEKAQWTGGYAKVDLSAVSDIGEDKPKHRNYFDDDPLDEVYLPSPGDE
jgi:hypothetical protein